jgi:hypothetical protein
VGVRWNSWNHFGCGINENLIKQTGTPAPLPNETNITKIALKKYHINKKNLLRVRTKGNETNKKRGEETFACCCWQRRRKKNGLIRDVEFVRPIYSMIYPFQLFGAFLLVR